MDEQLLQLNRWSFQLQRGEDLTLIPSDEEPFVVTEVFLVNPQSAAGHGVVSAYVEMGTQKILLAHLSSEVKAVELENPLVLEEEFRVYVMRPGGDADEDTDEDALVVQFKGFMVSLPCYSDTDTDDEEEEEEEEDEEDASSEDHETNDKDEESDGEVDGDVAKASSNVKD
nr:NAD-dependent protein deacetylase HST1-like [Lolium perenne]